jgi:hypothetical protein
LIDCSVYPTHYIVLSRHSLSLADMAGFKSKKRTHADSTGAKSKVSRPNKKQKKQPGHHGSDEEEADGESFQPVSMLDSDDEADLDATVDDGASSSDSESSDEEQFSARQTLKKQNPKTAKPKSKSKLAQDAPPSSDDEEDGEEDDSEDELDDGAHSDADSFDLEADDDDSAATATRAKSKRNDPTAFATSLQKILGTKLATSRRSDPLLSRSAEAQQASRDLVDSALEAKARRQMRQQKLAALEKGRVRDVLVATRNEATGEVETSTSEILETERRLRKTAQRGVVKLFNAVRQAQVKGQEAEQQSRKDGFVGVKGREEKVTEMSRKGFLDLIASGGGGLKKGGIEEA